MMEHSNIAKVLDAGATEAGRPFFVMELVRGLAITKYCDENNLTTRERLGLFVQVCRAIQHAHQKGIIHRDIKPSNILVTLHDGVPVPKVIDFGIAKATQGRLTDRTLFTAFEQFIGTPAYMSPEQAEMSGLDIDTRSDIYSLGVLLYELLTGRPPFDPATFQASGLDEMRRIIREVEPPRPSTRLSTLCDADRLTVAKFRGLMPVQLASLLSGDLDWVVMKALEKNRARRYESASALAGDLERHLRNEPVLARPPSTGYLLQKLMHRHRLAFASAAAIIAALVIGLGAATWSFLNERVARQRAVAAERTQLELRRQAEAARLNAEEELYASSLQIMSRTLTMYGGGDPRRERQILEGLRPRLGGRDLRGFEWRYAWLHQRTDATATLEGHHHVVDATLFSPAGNRLATHSLDGTVKIWDAVTMRELRALTRVATMGGFTMDGSTLIFSRPDHSIWQLDVASGEVARLSAPGGQLIAASPDGRQIVVFGADRLPARRMLDTTTAPGAATTVPAEVVAAVSADFRCAAVAGPGYAGIVVVDLGTGRAITTLPDRRPVIAIALSPDGARLASAGFDGVLKMWDVPTGLEQHKFKAFLDPIWGLAFSPDGRSLAAGGNNRTVKTWDTSSWAETASLHGHESTVRCVAFSPDGKRLATGAEDELALVWPAHPEKSPDEAPRLLRGPEWSDHTPSLAFSPDGRQFAGTAADGTLKVWRTDTVVPVASFATEARTVAFSPDGKFVLGEKADGTIQRWSLDSRRSEEPLRTGMNFANWQTDPLTAAERVALISEQRETRGVCRTCEIPSARDGINAGAKTSPTIAMSPLGHTMFVGSPDGRVEIWDVDTRKRLLEFQGHKLQVTAIAVSADGRLLATGSLDNATQLWDAATGQHLASFFAHNRPVWALAFSPDGQTLAAGSCDKEIILCSIPLRRHVASLPLYVGEPKGYEQEVRLLRFSPDSNLLAAALGDGTVRFFRAAPFAVTDAATHRPTHE
jgi:WD40 repeat protein